MLKILLSSFLLIANFVYGSPIAKLSEKQLISEYLKYHKDYYQKICPGNTDKEAEDLYKSYLGDGLYIPFLLNGDLDVEAINDNLPYLKKRKEWLDSVLKKLNEKKSFSDEYKSLLSVQSKLIKLRRHYHNYYLAKGFEQKKIEVKKSKEATTEFLKELNQLLTSLFFLQSFNFPVDHLYLRVEYDKVKSIDTPEAKKKTNQIYFLRKIIEEGAVDREKGLSDLSIRAVIDSVFLRIDANNETFLGNNLMYDIEYLIGKLDDILKKNLKSVVGRIENWQSKTLKDISFYEGLVQQQKNKSDLLKKIFKDKNKARYALSDFIYTKEAQVYKYWQGKQLDYQKLFVLETILIHEVGRLDDNYGTERKDVIKVVLNRIFNPEYNNIPADEPIYQKLISNGVKDIEKSTWLNVLFKQGEFSFTYFFIPASRGIFCADQSRSARNLRVKNLKIILDILKNSDKDFQATRYFSRASMLGRIDMAGLWDEYTPVNERPGPIIKRDRKLKINYKKMDYTFLYSFTNNSNVYEVLRMKGEEFVYSPKLKKFYNYRNPHFFKYFIKNRPY